MTGVEFAQGSNEVVFATVGTPTEASGMKNGIVRIDFSLPSNQNNHLLTISNSTAYAGSQLTSGYNKRLVVSGSDHLRLLNSWTGALAEQITNIKAPESATGGYRYFPVQVNGWDYNFAGAIEGPRTVRLNGTSQNNPATFTVPLLSGYTYSWFSRYASVSANQNTATITFPQSGTYSVTVQASPSHSGICGIQHGQTIQVEAILVEEPCCIEGRQAAPQTSILLYPNPASVSFSLSLPDGLQPEQVKVFDLAGRAVKVFQAPAKGQSFELEGVANGLYVVHVQSQGSSFQEKLLVNQ